MYEIWWDVHEPPKRWRRAKIFAAFRRWDEYGQASLVRLEVQDRSDTRVILKWNGSVPAMLLGLLSTPTN